MKPLKISWRVRQYLEGRLEHWEELRKNFNKYFSHLTPERKKFIQNKIYGQWVECRSIARRLGVVEKK